MSNFARVVNKIAVDISTNPEEQFHSDIAAEFQSVPDEVQVGWVCDDQGIWSPPKPGQSNLATPTRIGPIAFQMLFTAEELTAIDAAKESNPAIRIFWKLLDDPRTDYVDRNLEPVQSMLQSLEAGGLIGPGRAQEIITGEVAK